MYLSSLERWFKSSYYNIGYIKARVNASKTKQKSVSVLYNIFYEISPLGLIIGIADCLSGRTSKQKII